MRFVARRDVEPLLISVDVHFIRRAGVARQRATRKWIFQAFCNSPQRSRADKHASDALGEAMLIDVTALGQG